MTVDAIAPLVKRQFREHRGLMVTVLLLAVLAGALGNLGVVFAHDYPRDFRSRVDELGSEHVQVAVPDAEARDAAVEELEADLRVTRVATQEARLGWSNIEYNGENATVGAAFVDLNEETPLGQSHVVFELKRPLENPIYVPLMLSTGGNYQLGDPFEVEFGNESLHFRIQGFTENVFGGALSMSTLIYGLPAEGFEALANENPVIPQAWLVRAQVADTADASDVLVSATNRLDALASSRGGPTTVGWALEWGLVVNGLSVGGSVYAAILVGLAALLTGIAALVAVVTIRNAIRDDITAFGVQRSLGYTTSQIGAAVVIPVTVAGLIGAGVGVALSYLPLGPLAGGMSAQTGVQWQPSFSGMGLVVVPALGVFCALAAFGGTWSIRRVSAVTALRGGTASHTFRCNVLPLGKTRGPLTLLLGVKGTVNNLGQSLTIGVVIAATTFAAIFAVTVHFGLFADKDTFTNVMVGRIADVSVAVNPGTDSPELRSELESVDGVDQLHLLEFIDGAVDDHRVALTVAEDYAALPGEKTIYEGREPLHDNEIAIGGKVAEAAGVGIGDSVELGIGDASKDMLVTGLIQSTRRLGMSADITLDAMRALTPSYDTTMFSVWLKPGADSGDVVSAFLDMKEVDLSEDQLNSVNSQIEVYRVMVRGLVLGILTLTTTVVVLVTAMSALTIVSKNRHTLGISKALGFSSGQLIGQTIISYLPATLLGVLVGVIAGALGAGPALTVMLRNAGIMRLDFLLPWTQFVAVGVAIAALTLLMTYLAALRVRRISAYRLLTA